MTDIFISYAREDKERVRPIVEELEKRGWSVFWDTKLLAGDDWREYIGEQLDASSCVLVVWSRESIASKWVIKEATEGEKRAILVPLLLDAVEPPFGFRDIHAENLSDWNHKSTHQAFRQLITAIESKIASSDQPVITPTPTPALRPRKTAGNESWLSKSKQKQAAIAVAVVLVVILLFVGLIGRKKEEIPAEQAPTALSTPAPLDAEAVKAKQEAAARKQQADEAAKVKAEQDAAVERQKAAELKARQKADSIKQAGEAKLQAKREAAERIEAAKLKARQETDARKQQAEEAARVKAEKKAADARQKAEKLKAEKEVAVPKKTKLIIGDKYGGGIVFDVDATGQHGLIAAKADLPGPYFTWDNAKKACANLVENGYSDWYLSSKDELNKLYHAKSAVGGFADYNGYWGSTEGSANGAWGQYFGGGNQYVTKSLEWRVRPVRAF